MEAPGSPKSPESTFDSANHFAFSNFAHIPDIGSLSFAVGLREEEDEDAIVAKLLPMTKILPVKPMERPVRRVESADTGEACQKPDCVAKRERLEELKSANDGLKAKLQELEKQVDAASNKLASSEDEIAKIEEENDKLRGQVEDAIDRIDIIEKEASDSSGQNDELRSKVNALTAEIDSLKAQADEKLSAVDSLKQAQAVEVVFASSRSGSAPPVRDAKDVQHLDRWNPRVEPSSEF